MLKEQELALEAQEKLKSLAELENSSLELILFGIDSIIKDLEKDNKFVLKFGVNFNKDYEVVLEYTEDKPKDWAYLNVVEFLLKVCAGLYATQNLVYSFVLEFGKPAVLEIGEFPDMKSSSYDFKFEGDKDDII